MANRLVSNVIIIDSSGQLVTFPGDGRTAKINSVSFWGADSTGLLELALQSSSSDVVVKLANPVNASATVHKSFPGGQTFDKLNVKILTAGTGWIYLS